MQTIRFIATAAFAIAAAAAQAADPAACARSGHPAMAAAACAAPAGIDPNTFIVQPPASTRWVAGHANFEHPAVVIARQSRAIDANTFIVQPPVAVNWTVQEPDRMLAGTPAATAAR